MTKEEKEADGMITKFIEPRVSLMWLLSSVAGAIVVAGTMLWNIGIASAKIDELLVVTQKLEKRLDDRDVRTDQIMQMIFAIRQLNDAQNFRLDDLERRENTRDSRPQKGLR